MAINQEIISTSWEGQQKSYIEAGLKSLLQQMLGLLEGPLAANSVGSNQLTQELRDVINSIGSKVPNTRTVNSKELSSNITIGPDDIMVGNQTLADKLDDMDDAIGQGGDTSVLASRITALENALDRLTGTNDSTQIIDTFNEVIDFLANVNNDETLLGKLQQLQTQINSKANDNAVVKSISVNGGTPQTPQNGNVNIQVQTGSTISPADTAPSMDGTANVGSSAKYAREDHVHPRDTSKQDKLTSNDTLATINGTALKYGGSVSIPDGKTPYIGSNGNWFIGNTDLGVSAQGPAGNVNINDASQLVAILVNNLITGGAGNILSAEMGKLIGQYLGVNQNVENVDQTQISTTNAWLSPSPPVQWSQAYTCRFIPIEPGCSIVITASNNNICLYSFLKSTANSSTVNGTPDFATDYNAAVTIQAGQSATVVAPDDAHYLYVSAYSTGDRAPASIIITYPAELSGGTLANRLAKFVKSDDLSDYDFSIEDESGYVIFAIRNGHIVTKNFDSEHIEAESVAEEPYNKYAEPVPCLPIDNTKPLHLGQINVIRKALQHCNIKWTPVRETFRATGNGWPNLNTIDGKKYFVKGYEYTGIPYSSPSFVGKAVGSDVSLETFMTAVKNPNSVLYTIDLGDYVANVGPFYGNNCSSFTNVAQGINCMCKGRNNNFAGNKILESSQNVEALQIGDVIYLTNPEVDSGHTIVIIGIEKDENGFITKIIEAEQDGTCAKVYEYTPAQFKQRYFKGGYGLQYGWIYRNTKLVDNIEFKQEFIGVYDDERETIPYTYSETIGINIGNRANFNKSDSMPIEVSLLDVNAADAFTLYKGTTSLGVYYASSGSSGYGSTKIVTINKANLDAGTYEVRPSSGVSQYFCVAVPGTVTKSYDAQGNIIVTTAGQSSNVLPYGVVMVSNRPSRTTRGLWLMNGANSVTIPKKWLDYINTTEDIAYVSVVYRNEFGNIYSDFVEL